MKKIFALCLCVIMLFSLAACGGTASGLDATAKADELAENWIKQQIENNSLFSFTYNGEEYQKHIRSWKKTVNQTEQGWDVVYTSKDGVTFTVTISYDKEHAALDWVGSFRHDGTNRSGVIGNVLMLDAAFPIADGAVTTANNGGEQGLTDYQAYTTELTAELFELKNSGGRSSQDAWPWFDITAKDQSHGIMLAIGWSGNWKASFVQKEDTVCITAGMQGTNYYMESGETFRTPSIVVQFFQGDQDAGHNAWRQLLLANYNPKTASGEDVSHAPLSINSWGGQGSEALIKVMENAVSSGQYFEYQWIDAGWYGDVLSPNTHVADWATQLGNWYYNPGYEGVGFSEIRKMAEDNGYGLLVWFEPARAFRNTKLYLEHPEFFLPGKASDTDESPAYLDFGNVQAREYITKMVIDFLDDMGCDFYRQDYNFDPAEAWTRNDNKMDPDGNRVGVTEIQYVTGHYAFLDAILATGRQIDNCASGGRQIDIEMTKRAIPLWRTDYTVSSADAATTAAGIYSQGAGLSWWVVHHGGMGSKDGIDNVYGFRATMASGITMGVRDDQAFAKKMIDELLYNREYMIHDFYILSQGYGNKTETTNAGYEYHIPEEGRGYLVCFRPGGSDDEETTFCLKGLDPEATYTIRLADSEETHEMTGQTMMEKGLKVQFPRTKVAHMIYFDKK